MTKTFDRSHEGWCIFLSSRSHFKANWISKISLMDDIQSLYFMFHFLVASTFLVKEGYNSNQLDGALVMGRQHILSETSLWIGLWIIMIKFKRCQLLIRDPAAKCSAKKAALLWLLEPKHGGSFWRHFFFHALISQGTGLLRFPKASIPLCFTHHFQR